MNPILLNSNVIIYLLSESIIWTLLAIAFFISLHTLFRWDFGSYSQEQYSLEKRAYLVETVILFAFVMKFLLLPYFAFTIDKLSDIVPGAMCGAGVISANSYGLKLLFLKLAILFFLVLWMALNFYDLRAKNYPYFKLKNTLFIVIFILTSIELYLDYSYFFNIDISKPVSCCSALFGQLEGANPLPFGLNISRLLILFYLFYIILLLTAFLRQNILLFFSTLLFLFLSYYAVVYFFGTYIYQLPTHKCPFCMLQRPYHYIGYAVWGTLFGGSFLIMTSAILSIFLEIESPKLLRWGISLLSLFVLIVSLYVAIYYFKNGVFL